MQKPGHWEDNCKMVHSEYQEKQIEVDFRLTSYYNAWLVAQHKDLLRRSSDVTTVANNSALLPSDVMDIVMLFRSDLFAVNSVIVRCDLEVAIECNACSESIKCNNLRGLAVEFVQTPKPSETQRYYFLQSWVVLYRPLWFNGVFFSFLFRSGKNVLSSSVIPLSRISCVTNGAVSVATFITVGSFCTEYSCISWPATPCSPPKAYL